MHYELRVIFHNMRNLAKTQENGGFTLLELAIVLLIGGFLLTASFSLLSTYLKQTELNTTNRRLTEIHEALNLYLQQNGRFPCPAVLNDGPGAATFGVENPVGGAGCVGQGLLNGALPQPVVYGAVPVRTINLPEEFIADAWGGRFTYAVTRSLAQINPGPPITTTYDRNNGGINVVDSAGNPVVLPAGSAQYVVVSHGPDHSGAFSLDGQAIQACNGAERQGENCDFAGGDAIFVTSLNRSESQGANQDDDIVRYQGITDFGVNIPAGAVMAFNLNTCPNEWDPYVPAEGRIIIGTNGGFPLGSTTPVTNDRVLLSDEQVNLRLSADPIDLDSLPPGSNVLAIPTVTPRASHQNMPPYFALLYCIMP